MMGVIRISRKFKGKGKERMGGEKWRKVQKALEIADWKHTERKARGRKNTTKKEIMENNNEKRKSW